MGKTETLEGLIRLRAKLRTDAYIARIREDLRQVARSASFFYGLPHEQLLQGHVPTFELRHEDEARLREQYEEAALTRMRVELLGICDAAMDAYRGTA